MVQALTELPSTWTTQAAALAGVAADMRAGEAEIGAQEIDQQGARLDLAAHLLAVDRHADRNHRLDLPSRLVPTRSQSGRSAYPGVMAA